MENFNWNELLKISLEKLLPEEKETECEKLSVRKTLYFP
jgi:hypothetical protein